MKNNAAIRGFTLIEVIVTILIIGILLSIGAYWFSGAKKSKTLEIARDGIVSALEQAKVNAVAGKGGTSYGVKFNSDSYVYFSGSSYSAGSPSNITYPIDSTLTITNTIPGTDDAVIFTRVTGIANPIGTIIISEIAKLSNHKDITVGSQGGINVI